MLQAQFIGLNVLSGRRVRLVRRAPEHAAFFHECTQDTEFMDLYRLSQNRGESIAQIEKRLEQEQSILPEKLRRFEWVIERLADDEQENQIIGLIAVADYQARDKRGEFLIGIRTTAAKKAGIALEASLLVFDFAFNQLNLHKLISFVYGYNTYSQANTLQLGLTQEGCLRQHIWHQRHGYIDLYQNGLLQDEFRANKRLAKLSVRLLKRDITLKAPDPVPLELDYLQKAQSALNQYISTQS